jgi:site-specific DNA recombinase
MITAEDKYRYIESSGITHHYIYYHCTKKSQNMKCSQKVITVKKLEEQIRDVLKSIEIIPEFRDWAIEIIKRDYHKELEERELIYNNLQKELKIQETKLYNLTDLLLEDRINKDDFDRRKKGIKEDICNLEKEIC